MTPPPKPIGLAGLQVRHATPADLEAILAIERACPTAPHWPPATYAAITDTVAESPQRCLLVAQLHHAVVGFAVGLVHIAEPTSELEHVAVAADARRGGIGFALCAAVLEWCRVQGAASTTLEVRSSSLAALRLYTKLGFVTHARRPNYYRDPEEDAFIMSLALVSPLTGQHAGSPSDALHPGPHAGKLIEDRELAEPG